MKLRYEVLDEFNEPVRCFANRSEAEAHCKLDRGFWIKFNKVPKRNLFREALERLGECRF
jgi:hypothetical protein